MIFGPYPDPWHFFQWCIKTLVEAPWIILLEIFGGSYVVVFCFVLSLDPPKDTTVSWFDFARAVVHTILMWNLPFFCSTFRLFATFFISPFKILSFCRNNRLLCCVFDFHNQKVLSPLKKFLFSYINKENKKNQKT